MTASHRTLLVAITAFAAIALFQGMSTASSHAARLAAQAGASLATGAPGQASVAMSGMPHGTSHRMARADPATGTTAL